MMYKSLWGGTDFEDMKAAEARFYKRPGEAICEGTASVTVEAPSPKTERLMQRI